MEQTLKTAASIDQVWSKRPLIISGPCSAETEEQVLQTAQRLAKTGKVDALRAGIWKPRTRPGSFEGIGTKVYHGCSRQRNLPAFPLLLK
jgi:chorismate mutase